MQAHRKCHFFEQKLPISACDQRRSSHVLRQRLAFVTACNARHRHRFRRHATSILAGLEIDGGLKCHGRALVPGKSRKRCDSRRTGRGAARTIPRA
jgi:hypothetical protein